MNGTPAPAAGNTGACPDWCTDHDGEARNYHRGQRRKVELRDRLSYFSTRGGTFGSGPEVVVHSDVLEGGLFISPDIARKVATLVEHLQHATKAQHRELADAIRKAAADITGDTNG